MSYRHLNLTPRNWLTLNENTGAYIVFTGGHRLSPGPKLIIIIYSRFQAQSINRFSIPARTRLTEMADQISIPHPSWFFRRY